LPEPRTVAPAQSRSIFDRAPDFGYWGQATRDGMGDRDDPPGPEQVTRNGT
jgi:hypothetical protein